MELGIEVFDLSDAEVEALEKDMRHTHKMLGWTAKELYGSCTPAAIKKVRQKADLAETHPDAWEAICCIQNASTIILGGFIRTLVPLVESFFTAHHQQYPTLTEEDYLQETYQTMLDMAYILDDEHCYSTLIYAAVKNRLRSFILKQKRESHLADHIKTLKRSPETRSRSAYERQYVARRRSVPVGPWEQGSPDYADELEEVDEDLGGLSAMAAAEEEEARQEELELQRRAVAEANLTQLQRGIINARMRGEAEKFRLQTYNPDTRRPYSRQALNYQFHLAKEQIQLAYARYRREMAA